MITVNSTLKVHKEAKERYNAKTSQKIWICKTNIASKKDLKKIEQKLKDHPAISRWSIDRDDADKVLRVVSEHMSLEELIGIVSEAGYSCEELPD